MANERENKVLSKRGALFIDARSFAITLYLSLIAEQGTEVPCLDRGRVLSLGTGRHYSAEGYYYCDDDGK